MPKDLILLSLSVLWFFLGVTCMCFAHSVRVFLNQYLRHEHLRIGGTALLIMGGLLWYVANITIFQRLIRMISTLIMLLGLAGLLSPDRILKTVNHAMKGIPYLWYRVVGGLFVFLGIIGLYAYLYT